MECDLCHTPTDHGQHGPDDAWLCPPCMTIAMNLIPASFPVTDQAIRAWADEMLTYGDPDERHAAEAYLTRLDGDAHPPLIH